MYTLTVKSHFDAAHFVRGYSGNCANMHGHRWFVVLKIRRNDLDSLGLAVDFRKVKEVVNSIIDGLDHSLLNDHEYFQRINPTTENLSKFLFEKLAEPISQVGATLTELEVWESAECGVSYTA